MTLVDRDPAELLAGLDAPLPSGDGPDLDAVVVGGRRRRRRGRVRHALGAVCLVGVLGVSGAALAPVLGGGPDGSPTPAAEHDHDRADGRTSWAATALPPGPIGVLAQEQVDAVLRGAQATGGGPLGPVRWSAAHRTAPGVRDGESLVAPSSSGGSLGYLVDQDPVTGSDGHLDVSAATADWSASSSVSTEGGRTVAGAAVREGDVVWSSSGFADGSGTSAGDGSTATSRDLVVGLLRGGVLYEVAWTGSPSGGQGQPSAAVLREAVGRIADAVSGAGLVTGADPGLTDGSAERDAVQQQRSAVAAAAEQALRDRLVEAAATAGVTGSAAWTAPVTGGGTSTWTDRGGVIRSAVTASGRAGWQDGAVEIAYALAPDDPEGGPTSSEDACDLPVLPDTVTATCRVLVPEGDESAVALATSERVLADRGGMVVPIHRVAVAQDGQQLLLEVTGTQLVLDDDELLALARAVRADLTAADAEVTGLQEP